MACFRESDRKKIHAKLTKQKVSITLGKSLNPGASLFGDSICISGLLAPLKKKGMYKTAWREPQMTKVQLAPCHNPLSKKMMKIFLIALELPSLEPPSGMYR